MNRKILVILYFIILVLTIGSVSAGFFDFMENTNKNNNVTNDEKTFVVGFSSKFPPFGYSTENGSYTGFDLDLAKEVCKRNNWTYVEQPIINWDSKRVELNSGGVDCIWSEFTINNRENEYEWTEPYFNNTQVFVVNSHSNISSIDDLKGKTVEVLTSSSGLEALEVENKSIGDTVKIQKIDDYQTGFMDLESNACDALLVDIGCAKYHMTEKFNSNFKILDQPLKYEQYGVAFKKGNTELKDQVQKTLDEMYKDGTVDKIAQNYSKYEIQEHIIHR